MQFNNIVFLIATSVIETAVYGQPANSSPNAITNQLDRRTFLPLLQMKQQLLGMMMGGGGFGGNSNSEDSMSYDEDHQSQTNQSTNHGSNQGSSHTNNQGSTQVSNQGSSHSNNQGSSQGSNQGSSHSNNQGSSQGSSSNQGSGQKEINITNVFNSGKHENGSDKYNGSSQFTTNTSHQNFNSDNLSNFQGYCSNQPGITCRMVCQVSRNIQSNSGMNQSTTCNNSPSSCDANSTSCRQSYDPKDCHCECQAITKGSDSNPIGTGSSPRGGSNNNGKGNESIPSTSGKGSTHGSGSYHY